MHTDETQMKTSHQRRFPSVFHLCLSVAGITAFAGVLLLDPPPLPPETPLNLSFVGPLPPQIHAASIPMPTVKCTVEVSRTAQPFVPTGEWEHDPVVYSPNIIVCDTNPVGQAFYRIKP